MDKNRVQGYLKHARVSTQPNRTTSHIPTEAELNMWPWEQNEASCCQLLLLLRVGRAGQGRPSDIVLRLGYSVF
jgi:hypothetical protein